MKSCPTYNRLFEDTLTYCLVDGAMPSAPFDPHTTIVIPDARKTDPPTEILPIAQSSISNKQQQRQPPMRHLLVGSLLALLVTGIIITIIITSNYSSHSVNANPSSTSSDDNYDLSSYTYIQAEIIFSRWNADGIRPGDINPPANLSTGYIRELLKIEGVEAATPVIRYAIPGKDGTAVEQVEGIDWESYAQSKNAHISSIRIAQGRAPVGHDEVIIDEIEARNRKINVGDQVIIFDRPFHVIGFYSSKSARRISKLEGHLKIPLIAMQDLLDAPGKCSYILIKCRNTAEQSIVARRINKSLPGNVIQFTRDVVK
jgi:ABC-type lipoprotein release transport system permease subunit